MPEPAETLSLFSELSIALAGFSGIVVVLGRRQSGQLSPMERRRLGNLFAQALAALFTSLFALTLLHAGIPDVLVWRVASAAWALAAAIMFPRDWYRLRALSESEWALVDRRILVPAYTAIIVTLLLQVSNSVHLHEFWPLLVALSLSLLLAFQQFVLLLYSGFRAV